MTLGKLQKLPVLMCPLYKVGLFRVSVTKLQGFTAEGILLKNETGLLSGSFIHLQKVKDAGFTFKALSPRRVA